MGIWTILGVYILPLFDIALLMLYQRRIKLSGSSDKTSSMMPQSWKVDEGWWGQKGMPPQEDMRDRRTRMCSRNGSEEWKELCCNGVNNLSLILYLTLFTKVWGTKMTMCQVCENRGLIQPYALWNYDMENVIPRDSRMQRQW